MTTTISLSLVGSLVTKVRELATAKPETVYRPAWTDEPLPTGQCSYLGGTCSDGSVGCLVGQALLAMGFMTGQLRPVDQLGIVEALEKLHPCELTEEERDKVRWLETVQSAQDNSQPWQGRRARRRGGGAAVKLVCSGT
jgi:hypothetical protein